MGEIAGELMALFADGFVRRLFVARARRRLAAGKPVRIPCSARSDGPGWPPRYVSGRIRVTPGSASAEFGSRELDGAGPVVLAAGGAFRAPEPDTWHDQDWAATAYLEPGAGQPVFLQVDSRYLPLLHLALAAPESPHKV
ncbi:hypothetical protein ABT263_31000 [Kitasatospora sp. NPDC001603]|uniref:hypothetical protein n=1 Tax=Kitasatospora sp. NPDC001603 TaxID=3154388 RepID=UPI003318B68B